MKAETINSKRHFYLFTKLFFKIAYEHKLHLFRARLSTRLYDRILFKQISRSVVGGRVRLMISGGAMLSKEVQESGGNYRNI